MYDDNKELVLLDVVNKIWVDDVILTLCGLLHFIWGRDKYFSSGPMQISSPRVKATSITLESIPAQQYTVTSTTLESIPKQFPHHLTLDDMTLVLLENSLEMMKMFSILIESYCPGVTGWPFRVQRFVILSGRPWVKTGKALVLGAKICYLFSEQKIC